MNINFPEGATKEFFIAMTFIGAVIIIVSIAFRHDPGFLFGAILLGVGAWIWCDDTMRKRKERGSAVVLPPPKNPPRAKLKDLLDDMEDGERK